MSFYAVVIMFGNLLSSYRFARFFAKKICTIFSFYKNISATYVL